MTPGIKVVVSGSRYLEDRKFVFASLDLIHAERNIVRLAHGDCAGADHLAKLWAVARKIDVQGYPANWTEFPFGDPRRRAAGPRRNELMIKTELPDLVIAFPGGRGTRDLMRQAEKLNIPIIEVAQWTKSTS